MNERPAAPEASGPMTPDPAGGTHGERLARAVEHEVRRRKRQIRTYLLLLLVPLGMGVIAVLTARKDGDRLRTVEASLDSVQPSLAAISGLDTALAQVATASTVLRSTASDVARLREEQQAIQDRLESSVTALRSSQLQIRRQTDSLRSQVTPQQLGQLETALVRVDQVQAALQAQDAQIDRLEQRQLLLKARQDSQLARYPLHADILNRLQRLELRSDTIRSQILRTRPDLQR